VPATWPNNPLVLMRIAIVHEWMAGSGFAGSERVVEQLLRLYPEADVFATVDFFSEQDRQFLGGKPVHTSFIQRLPFARRLYKQYLPLAPLAVEQFDLSDYDLVLSSNHAVAKGVLTGPDQLHISYVHSPIRYAWDLQHQYLHEAGLERGLKSWLTRWILHRIRLWDIRTANGVDQFVANSHFIARRIRKVYRREAAVVYPPVNIDAFTLHEQKEDFYLAASRMVPYKRLDLIVEAFAAMPDKRLVVIGDGPDFRKVKSRAGRNIELLGYQPFEVLRSYMQRARAFVFAAVEDFGIMPVEAQACGTPVIAYRKGGVMETVRGLEHEMPTGVFFDAQTTVALQQAIQRFEQQEASFQPSIIRKNALYFSEAHFREGFHQVVERAWATFQEESGTERFSVPAT
jgi:glycosyltransferase involved in cell wall biosynthesis